MTIVLLLSAGVAAAQRRTPAAATPAYRILHEVPAPFRGGWDELGNCAESEPRYSITATSFYDFEVRWQVREVRMTSPTEIDIIARYHDPDRGVTDEETTWSIRLVDGGRAITEGHGSTEKFPRCADALQRD